MIVQKPVQKWTVSAKCHLIKSKVGGACDTYREGELIQGFGGKT
jgi:hypothetical protein